MNAIYIDIDRIVLTDVDVVPDRAERIREMIEVELQCLLERQGLSDSMVSRRVSYLSAPTLEVTETPSDDQFAIKLAQSITHAMRNFD